jgi:hypothetical protein
MGTRCLTYLYKKAAEKPFTCIYRQFDGYPEGHGFEIAEFMNSKTMVDGYNDAATQINGMHCLASQLIVLLKEGKTEAGGIYIHHPDDNECGQDYEYHIWADKVQVKDPGDVIFEGNWKEFLGFCKQ